MWKKMIRNMEWLVIVALLVGAVMAVGCGEGSRPGSLKGVMSKDRVVVTNKLYTLYASAANMDPGAWVSSATNLDTKDSSGVSAYDPKIYDTVKNAYPLDVKFALAGQYRVSFFGTLLPQKGDSVYDTLVEATLTAVPPDIADAGIDRTVTLGEQVTLAGSGGGGYGLKSVWNCITSPVPVLIGVASTFTPQLSGTYVFQYTLYQTILEEFGIPEHDDVISLDTVTITVIDPQSGTQINTPPVADAGPDLNATVGNQVSLSGRSSSDPDNGSQSLTYGWNLVSKPVGSSTNLIAGNTSTPRLTPDSVGNYVISLIVYDGKDNSVADTVTITVAPAAPSNTAPVANAGSSQAATVGSLVTLNGSASSDADGNNLTYSWFFTTMPVGSSALLTNRDTVAPSFTPDLEGGYIANLVVNDGTVNSTIATVTITVGPNTAPVVNAGPDQNATVNTLVTLNGNMSSDPEGNSLRYSWGFIAQPIGSIAVLNNNTSVSPSFTPDLVGDYVIDLDVYDGALWSLVDTVTITVSDPPPPVGCALDSGIYNFCIGYTTQCSFVTGGNANCDSCRAAGCF